MLFYCVNNNSVNYTIYQKKNFTILVSSIILKIISIFKKTNSIKMKYFQAGS